MAEQMAEKLRVPGSRRTERKAEAARARGLRRERFQSRFAASHLAIAGAVISAAFLFQGNLVAKTAMALAFMAATWYSGKRFSLMATLFVSATIVAANLLLPFGKILFSFGPIMVTEGALLGGIEKAVTFEGLMYISKACILPSLKLPGRFGSVVAKAFVYYDRIIEYKGKVKPATLVADADALMLEIWDSETEKKAGGTIPAGTDATRLAYSKAGYPVSGIAIIVALSALACLSLLI
jgi:heptaprenyl diphosphate synthase